LKYKTPDAVHQTLLCVRVTVDCQVIQL